MNILETILAHKREEVATNRKTTPVGQLKDMPAFGRPCLSLEHALRGKDVAVIAEIKKASPSRNVIRDDFDPLAIAREYQNAGARALSVLTDQKFFQGSLRYIDDIRSSVSIPILRKDFIVDSYQLYESKAHGADAVLLIVAALDMNTLSELHEEARELGLECLIEVHNEEELQLLNPQDIRLLGINNRDLTTFDTDLATSFHLKKLVPSDVIVVSESGINSRNDIDRLLHHGIHAMLIGESLMSAKSPGKALAELLIRDEEIIR
jgi:indole-3-glycerol phosphate synthase